MFCELKFSLNLGKYLEVGLLCPKENVCLFKKKKRAILYSEVAAHPELSPAMNENFCYSTISPGFDLANFLKQLK